MARAFDVRRTERSGLPVFELAPRGPDPVRTVLYLHGGGFVSGLDRFHWRYAARLARGLGVRVVLPAYPLTPTHTWLDALPRLVDLFEQLAVESPQGVVVMGDSAGGGLAVGLAQLVARRSGPQPTHLVAFAPWVDLTGETPGTVEAAARRPVADAGQAAALRHLVGRGRPAGPRGQPADRRPVGAAPDAGAVRHPGPAGAAGARAGAGRASRPAAR